MSIFEKKEVEELGNNNLVQLKKKLSARAYAQAKGNFNQIINTMKQHMSVEDEDLINKIRIGVIKQLLAHEI